VEKNVSEGGREQQVDFSELVAAELIKPQPSIGYVDPMYAESIRSFLKRPYPIAAGVWTGSQAFGANVLTIPLMSSYLSTVATIREKLTGFKYIRGGMKVAIRVNGTRFHYGMMVLAFYPMDILIGAVGAPRRNVGSATMMPSIFVNPTSDGLEELEVPYVYTEQFLKLNDGSTNNFGDVNMYVLDPLKSVNQTTVGAVSWTLYARFVDPVVTGFTQQTIDVTPTAAAIEIQGYVGESATRVVPEFLNGFNTDGNDTSISAGVVGYPAGADPVSEIAFNRADMELKTLYTYPNPILHFPWSSDSPVGTQLSGIRVYPNFQGWVGTPAHYLSTISQAFAFWRGALRYKVMVVASGFHSGRLQISWNPATGISSSVSTVELSNTNHIIMDIQQTTEIYFTVPYLHHQPWQPVADNTQSAAVSFNVLNSLATPSGATSLVNIFVWLYGSDTLEFALPRITVNTTGPISQPLFLTDDDVIEEQCYKAPLSDPRFGRLGDASDVPDVSCMGERIHSILQITRKYALASTFATGAGQDAVIFRPFNRKTAAVERNTHYNLFCRMYLAVRGPLRLAATVDVVNAGATAASEQYYLGIDASTSTTSDVIGTITAGPSPYGFAIVRPDSAPNPALILPWYCNQLFALAYHSNFASDSPLRYPAFIVTKYNGPTPVGVFRIFMSTTSDFQFGFPIAPIA
jgi:hypothetical protein